VRIWKAGCAGGRTDLAHDLVVLQHAPGYIHAVVVPVGARHVRVDVGVHASHAERLRIDSVAVEVKCEWEADEGGPRQLLLDGRVPGQRAAGEGEEEEKEEGVAAAEEKADKLAGERAVA
jgi:hypothetical protein